MRAEGRRGGHRNGVELKELVYAPLYAVAEANMRLSSNIVDFLATTGDMSADETGKPTVNLHTIQMQYDQLRNDAEQNAVAERIGLEIPLLSIYPLSSLRVSKTKVSFDAEVRETKTDGDAVKIFTQVTSRKQRGSAGQARICFDVELESVPISEGLSRFVDTLNAQAVPKLLNVKPLDGSGKALTGKELEDYNRRMELAEREKELNDKLAEVTEVIRTKNNELSAEVGMNYDEYIEHLECTGEKPDGEDVADLCGSIKEYREIGADLEEQLEEIRRDRIARQFQDGEEEEQPQAARDKQSGGRRRE